MQALEKGLGQAKYRSPMGKHLTNLNYPLRSIETVKGIVLCH